VTSVVHDLCNLRRTYTTHARADTPHKHTPTQTPGQLIGLPIPRPPPSVYHLCAVCVRVCGDMCNVRDDKRREKRNTNYNSGDNKIYIIVNILLLVRQIGIF